VICGLSGGVDSAVVAALLYKAIGSQLSCILVNNGLLRKDEQESVIAEFTSHFKADLHVVDAETAFWRRWRESPIPQAKRRCIGHAFIECFKHEATADRKCPLPGSRHALPGRDRKRRAQDGPAATIKLHHNVGGLPAELGFELIEPLRDLFKDEVRQTRPGAGSAR
jgi:GMP synthase (glutamine-hydrolysing)